MAHYHPVPYDQFINIFMFVTNHPENSNKKFYWISPDTEKTFEKNKKVMGNDWIYQNAEIPYCHDEYGFRIKQLGSQKCRWEESIVVFGCSNVYGIGLVYEDTFCYQLEQMLGIPVINLGMPASAVDFATRNSYILYKNFPHPRASVHMWTELSRQSDWYGKNNLIAKNNVPSSPNYYPDINWEARSEHLIDLDRTLWKDKTIYYESTFWYENSIRLGIDMINTIDTARDVSHPGPKTNYLLSLAISERLKSKGI